MRSGRPFLPIFTRISSGPESAEHSSSFEMLRLPPESGSRVHLPPLPQGPALFQDPQQTRWRAMAGTEYPIHAGPFPEEAARAADARSPDALRSIFALERDALN